MARHRDDQHMVSRRSFLKAMSWAPVAFTPGLFSASPRALAEVDENRGSPLSSPDFQLHPHYPAKSPLDDVLRYVNPGSDEYVAEKYAAEIHALLAEWGQQLRRNCPALSSLVRFLDASMAACGLKIVRDVPLRSGNAIEVLRREFVSETVPGHERFLDAIKAYFGEISRLETAEFEIVGVEETQSPRAVSAEIRYSFVGVRKDGRREQRIGKWLTEWLRDESGQWKARRWQARPETVSRARGPMFVDITSRALGEIPSYKSQMLRGVDYWRTVLDGACGIDIYGNNGVALGDYDTDGRDDIYVCQPAGLPNRLYRNRGDGIFEDVTEPSGVGVLDATACALFADFENKGVQDLLVVCGSGPLLFVNEGNGKFSIRRDAFHFQRPPQGTFTHAAVADYDRDGRLDVYFCLYSYYLGLDQYHYPAPYFDARNGPPNFLFHNEGNGTFADRTEASGLNIDNDRYSFACAWGDHNSNGCPDLCVANDFGRSNLYRNNGDGTFTSISREAGVEEVGAGMSACWFDFDNDGKQDIYVANMWSAAGIRVSQQQSFHEKATEDIRALYRQHARGNSMYRNRGEGYFENVSSTSGVEMGRWAWSSDAWDFDQDGWPDLYVTNGYISGPERGDLGSFFWRRVVGKSPRDATPSAPYERGWNGINELIRSDHSWSGYERNVFYLNNRNGTFSDISGLTGLDFPDDSRAFALADLDGDGRLEVVLKNRNAPQLRILRNAMGDLGNSIAVRLRGQKSNRDAIGAAITVEAGGHRQTKYLQAGSGFLSQHTKEVFFGLGVHAGNVRAVIRWPSGLTQRFENLPVGNRISIEESSEDFVAKPFTDSPRADSGVSPAAHLEALPTSVETWLIEPLAAPDFSLPDLAQKTWDLRSFRGAFVLLSFWTSGSQGCQEQVRLLQQKHSRVDAQRVRMLTIHLDEQRDIAALRTIVGREGVSFPVLLGNEEVAGVYNILYRYLYDRRRNLPLPTSFLVDEDGMIVKIYQGLVNPDRVLEDLGSNPSTAAGRLQKALPFPGKLHLGSFQRNDFSYGVALFQHGYLEQAAASFKQVIAAKPNDPEAYYNLGTLYLRRNDLANASEYLEKAVSLRSNYPEAWNNLGMIAAQQGQTDTAIRQFQQSLHLRPDYATALLNLGNLYRRQGNLAEAEKLLLRALDIEPENAEVNYSLGMLYGQQDQVPRAFSYFDKALTVRPDYAEALNNLGVLMVREKRYSEAEQKFNACIDAAPQFDQAYLNLARLYVMLKDRQRAKTVLQGLLRQQPQHRVAQQMLEMLR
jgi:Flp pilus assembly protein TadD/peroxiredoxin